MKVTNIASTVFFLCPLYPNDQVSLFNPEFYCITGDVNAHLQVLRRGCQIARELDCSRIRIFPFRWPDNRKPPFGTIEHQEKILENLRKAVEIAEEENITLVLENCPYSHLPKGKMTLNMVKAIENDHLRLLWDPANSYRAIQENVPQEYRQMDLLKELEEIYPYIDHIHLKDYHYVEGLNKPFVHKAIGQGDIDFVSIFDFLKEKDYDKAISLEPEVSLEDCLISMDQTMRLHQK